MNPYAAAYQQQAGTGWTRIDLLLALFDGTVAVIAKALAALERGDPEAARPVLARAQILVLGLASGLTLGAGEIANNLGRLYEFVLHGLGQGSAEPVSAALKVLRTVREGFEGTRQEARDLERRGAIPPVDATSGIQAVA